VHNGQQTIRGKEVIVTMRERIKRSRGIWIATVVGMLACLGFAAVASAHEGEFAKFNNCPSTNPEVVKCLYSQTNGGEVVLGKDAVPVVKPAVLQGGISAPNVLEVSSFYGATDGETLSKAPQPVPGGLAGLVKCDEISNFLERLSCELTFENGVTGVNATLELAKPASEIKVSQYELVAEEGTALLLPVKVHLENPFLGSSCYVGSSSAPLIWNLTTGITEPPAPNSPISGRVGEIEFKENFEIVQINKNVLVDNAWSAPGAEGCGGLFAFLIDPIIDSQTGLPSAAGHNTAILKDTLDQASVASVNSH
jgi:hypothetical protein